MSKAKEVYQKLKQQKELEDILSKRNNGEQLTMEEEIRVINWNQLCTYRDLNDIKERIKVLESGNKVDNKEIKKFKNIHIIDGMYLVKEYEYKNKKFANFMVKVEGDDTLYTWDRILPIKQPISVGDIIYCEIEGDKFRNVKQLQNV